MNNVSYRACSNGMVYVPGVFRWAMASQTDTWTKEASDVAAKMYILADLLPEMPCRVMKLVAQESERVKVTMDEDKGTVTFELIEDDAEEGEDNE